MVWNDRRPDDFFFFHFIREILYFLFVFTSLSLTLKPSNFVVLFILVLYQVFPGTQCVILLGKFRCFISYSFS